MPDPEVTITIQPIVVVDLLFSLGWELKGEGGMDRQFQNKIALRLAEGYRLHSWQMSSCPNGNGGTLHTIVAVFSRQELARPQPGPAPQPPPVRPRIPAPFGNPIGPRRP